MLMKCLKERLQLKKWVLISDPVAGCGRKRRLCVAVLRVPTHSASAVRSVTLSSSLSAEWKNVLSWAGSDGVRVLRNPSFLPAARFAHMQSFLCVTLQLRSSRLYLVRGPQRTRALCLSLSTFTCTHETWLLREIGLRQGIGEDNFTCLYWDLSVLVSV